MDSINVGIIGFGRIGLEHANWLAASIHARPVAVADQTPARATLAQSKGLRVHHEVDDLLNDSSIHAILVATPTAMHFEHASRALAAGKHVLVEKPIALNLIQSRRLLELARRHGRVLSVFHNRRWDIDYLTVREHIHAGRFGKIINVESRLGQWSSCVGPAAREYRPNWRNEASFGGGGLFDWGSHFVDQIWRLLWPAKPLRVFAQLRANVWSKDCDDFARICIDLDNGATALVEINTTTTRPLPRWHIDGVAGSADSPHCPTFNTTEWANLSFHPAPSSLEGGTGDPPVASAGAHPLSFAEPGLTERQIWDSFALACLGRCDPAVYPESVLVTMMLLDAARESNEKGAVIDVADRVEWVY